MTDKIHPLVQIFNEVAAATASEDIPKKLAEAIAEAIDERHPQPIDELPPAQEDS